MKTDTIYWIDEEMLGNTATEQDTERAITFLRNEGFDARCGRNHDGDIPDNIWQKMLNNILPPINTGQNQ